MVAPAGVLAPSSPGVLDALRRHLDAFDSQHGTDPHRGHILRRILACRTPAMGTHQHICNECGWSAELFNSCRDRNCPQCQGQATDDWLTAQQARMLPVGHFQVVFTLPKSLRTVAYDNPELMHSLLFRVGASVIQDLAAQHYQARLGLTGVLHTWTNALLYHPHVHFLVSAGGLHLQDEVWVSTGEDYLFPGRVLGRMFRGRFLEGLLDAFERGALVLDETEDPLAARKQFRSMVRRLSKRHAQWVVHVEAPKGRSVSQVTKYLARYIKRVAISDSRILSVTDAEVTFRTRRGPVTVSGPEFVRRFQLHILPAGLRKVRHYGLYAPGLMVTRRERARALVLSQESPGSSPSSSPPATESASRRRTQRCPCCGSHQLRRVFIGRPLLPTPALPANVPARAPP